MSGEINWVAGAKRILKMVSITLVSIKRPNEFTFDLRQQ